MDECTAQYVGKNRNGTSRYWCTVHHAPISDGKGNLLPKCLHTSPKIKETKSNSLTISPLDYPGGIALWGATMAVYDTTAFNLDLGIHVHARKKIGEDKQIDKTFRYVHVKHGDQSVDFDYLAAIAYLSSNMLQKEMNYIVCPKCGFAHLDKDWFSVNPHKKHLCNCCGRIFVHPAPNIGNPLIKAKEIFGDTQIYRNIVKPHRKLEILQRDFPYGISFWGSNSALLWTSSKDEEYGIHVHAYAENNIRPTIDETYDDVVIDGVSLDIEMVRMYMAQKSLPYLSNRVRVLKCPKCGKSHFDEMEKSYTPHTEHRCKHCEEHFKTHMRLIGNPMEEIINELQRYTTLPLQRYNITDFYPGLEGW